VDSQRIDGIKYNLDALSDAELIGIRGNLLRAHARIIGEVSLLEFKLFQRTQDPLPFEEETMNSYAEIADVVIERTAEAQLSRTMRAD
jgi:hypothetical protein